MAEQGTVLNENNNNVMNILAGTVARHCTFVVIANHHVRKSKAEEWQYMMSQVRPASLREEGGISYECYIPYDTDRLPSA